MANPLFRKKSLDVIKKKKKNMQHMVD